MEKPNPESGVTEWYWFRYVGSEWQVVGVSRISDRHVNVFFTGTPRTATVASLEKFGVEWGDRIAPPKAQ